MISRCDDKEMPHKLVSLPAAIAICRRFHRFKEAFLIYFNDYSHSSDYNLEFSVEIK